VKVPVPTRSLVLVTFLLLIICVWQPAHAHQRSESASRWLYSGQQLSLRLTVRETDAQRLILGTANQSPQDSVAAYLAQRIKPSNDADCRRIQALRAVRSSGGYLQLEAKWACHRVPASLQIEALFDVVSGHIHFASFVHDEWFSQKLLSADEPIWRLEPPETDVAPITGTAHRSLFLEGVNHILGGADHFVFLLALLLICRRVPEAVWAVTGFTLGHSISLALAVLGVIQPNAPAIEAAIGLTIVLVIIERASNAAPRAFPGAMAVSTGLLVLLGFSLYAGEEWRSFLLFGMVLFAFCYLMLARDFNQFAAFRILATALFGLIHGLGFAGGFVAIEMPAKQLALSLVAFNFGVEFGQLLLVGFLALAWTATRLVRELRPLLVESLAAAALGMGMYWFVTRLFGQ